LAWAWEVIADISLQITAKQREAEETAGRVASGRWREGLFGRADETPRVGVRVNEAGQQI
jgi:hypothetical protein